MSYFHQLAVILFTDIAMIRAILPPANIRPLEWGGAVAIYTKRCKLKLQIAGGKHLKGCGLCTRQFRCCNN